MTKIEKRYEDLVARAKATGMAIGVHLIARPNDLAVDQHIEFGPLRVVDIDAPLASSLDQVEAALLDWEAHPESPRREPISRRLLEGYRLGYDAGLAAAKAKAEDAA